MSMIIFSTIIYVCGCFTGAAIVIAVEKVRKP